MIHDRDARGGARSGIGRRGALGLLVIAVACSSPEKQEGPREHLGKTSSALVTARYEAEHMTWSGIEGTDGAIKTEPPIVYRHFWGDGYVSQHHDFVGGSTTLTVRAMGELLDGIGPHIVVTVGGAQVGSTYVNDTDFTSKTFTFQAAAGSQEIRVTYDNDDWNSTESRNLLVDWVEVDEPAQAPSCSDTTYEAEAMPWSGTEGLDGEVRSDPPPTHRYFSTDGYVYENHAFAAGPMRIRVRANGELLGGVGPHMVVSVGGNTIGSAYVDASGYVDKTFDFTATTGTHEVRITYDNDDSVAPGGPGNDRNLLLDKVEVLCGSSSDGGTPDGGGTGDGGGGGEGDAGGTDAGACTPTSCTTSNACQVGECTPTGCVTSPAVDGTVCGGTTCTGISLCQAGVCVPGTPPVLSETACTYEVCDETGVHVLPKPAGTSCSNGNACDGAETCDGAGTCLSGTAPPIDDGNPCTADACDPALGVTHTPLPAGDGACSNGNACDGYESCNGAGACVAGAPPVIDDGNVCTVDECSPITGPVHTPIAGCDPTPTHADAPFETRASMMGRLVAKTGTPISSASFTVYDERAIGAPRADVEVQHASDGSFRIRLRDFPEAEAQRSPPHRLILVVESAGTLPARRVAYAHPGDAVDVGTIRLIGRDPSVTMIGPAGGTATDSQHRIEVVVPPGALTTTIPLQITPFDEREDFPAPLPDVTLTNYGMELEPTGTVFATPVTVRIANTQSLPTSLTIPTGFYDEREGRWEHLAEATWDGARFAFQTTHFTEIDANLGMVGDLVLVQSRSPNPNRSKSKCGTGSAWRSGGGSLEQSFALPSVHAAGEDFGLTLHYDSGLAGSRKLGPAPQANGANGSTGSLAVPTGSLAVSVSSVKAKVECVPRGSSSPSSTSPSSCTSVVGSCGTGGVAIRGNLGQFASERESLISTPSNATEVELSGGWFEVPFASSGIGAGAQNEVAQTGLVSQSVIIGSAAPSACVGSGGTFAVSDPLGPRAQVNAQSGPMMNLTRKVLVHHRFTSPLGSGWALQEISRLYADGDYAVLVDGDGQEEDFRPRARISRDGLTDAHTDAAFARDDQTGETFLVTRPGGVIARFDPVTGARTNIVTGLGLSDTAFHGLGIAYVGGVRRFVIAHQTGLYDVQPGGGLRQLVARSGPSDPFRRMSVAARGSDVFYTTGDSDTDAPLLFRFDLSEAAPARMALSTLAGDVRLDPTSPLSGVTFGALKGLAFASDGSLYASDSRRNVVYRILPDTFGRISGSSSVVVALGDGAGRYLSAPGARHPARAFSLNQPSALGMAEDGTLHVVSPIGVVSFDPLAKEAELLFMDGGRDEVMPSIGGQFSGPPSLLSLTKSSLVARSDEGLIRVAVDLLSSDTEPARTITRLPAGGFALLDTTRALVQSFDPVGRLIEQRRRTGEVQFTVTYADARSDRIERITNAAGGNFVFGYSNGKLQAITDPAGAVTTLTVNGQGDLVSIVEPDGETYSLAYDQHKMVSKTSPRGELTTYTYADDGTLLSSHKPGGESYSFQASFAQPRGYEASGRLGSSIGSYTDARGVTREFQTNEHGAIERETYVADGVSYVEQLVYPNLLQGLNEAPEARRRNRILRGSHWTLNGAPLSAPLFFDSLGRVVRQDRTVPGSGHESRWTYDSAGWLRSESLWSLTTPTAQWFERDAAGHVTRIYDAPRDSNGALPSGREQVFTWRPDGQLATATVHNVTTSFSYDDAGGSRNLVSASDTTGRTTTFGRDARGNVTSTSDGTTSASFTFDANNRLLAARDALGLETTLRYSHEGCGCTERDLVTGVHTPDLPAGVEWTFGYGAQGRLASVTDPHGFTESYTYEPTGELASVTDRRNRTTTATHDQLGRLLTLVDSAGRVHRRSYSVPTAGTWVGPALVAASPDATAAATALTAPLRSGDYQIGVNALDIEGMPARISLYRDATFELGYTRWFDDAGRLTNHYDRTDLPIDSTQITGIPRIDEARFSTKQFSYDIRSMASLPTAITSPVPPNGGESSTLEYDVELDVRRATGLSGGIEAAATHVYTRDVAGRVTSVANRFSQSVINGPTFATYGQAYTYRPDGRIASIENSDGAEVQHAPQLSSFFVLPGRHDFTYDARGLVATQTAFEGTYAYEYDPLGRNTRLEYPDGHLRVQSYDDVGRLTSRCYVYPNGSSPDRCYGAEYDPVGNPVRLTDPEGADVYEYDSLDRLTKVTREVSGVPVSVEEYAYNALGALRTNAGVVLADERPRLSGGGTAAAAIPASIGGQAVDMDRGGRVTSARGTSFGWSHDGHVKTAGGVRFGMDAYGRRAWAAGLGEYYQYEGAHRISEIEYAPVIAPLGRVAASYLYDGIDHPLRLGGTETENLSSPLDPPLYRTTPKVEAYYELDLAGNVRRLRGAGGADLGGYRYTAFGKTLEDTVSATLNQALRWKGRPYANFGGLELYDMRARQWSPELGAFLSIDEYQYHHSTTTLWGWPGQNPILFSDPFGRKGMVRDVPGMFFGALNELASTSRDATGWWASKTADSLSSGNYSGAAFGAAVTWATGVAAWDLTMLSGTLPYVEFAVAMTGSCPTGGRGARPPNMSPAGAGRSGAFRAAKAANGIPMSQQPSRVTPNFDRRGNVQPGRQYIFNEGKPNQLIIREDSAGHEYGPGDSQNRGPHFNDPSGNHYDY